MGGLTSNVIADLKATFPNLVILTPESHEYEENILRWNVAAEKRAVQIPCLFKIVN
jgi:hypothetical protein